MTRPTRYCALVAALVLLAGCASTAPSQEETPARSPNKVTAEDIERNPRSSIQELLQGRVAGVMVTQQGSGISVLIRGVNSFRGSTEPLYVMDGIPITPGSNGYVDVNPYDVKSIEVLKGPDAAIYGVRGGNGVIIITTKRGGDA